VSKEPFPILTDIQRVMLIMIRYAKRPGYIGHRRQVTLAALERRKLAQSRPDPTAPGQAIWTLTLEGRRWVDQDEANR
jgi:hypothetical protein